MSRQGLLVDYQWCTGCHSCEIACQMEHDLPPGQFGIKVFELGPWCYDEDKWQYRYIPVFTDQCNLCAKRQAKGKLPTCVKHCQSQCIRVARHDEIVHELSSKRRQFFMTV